MKKYAKKIAENKSRAGFTEHSFRPYLINLLRRLGAQEVVNEPGKGITGYGVLPDIAVMRDGKPYGYVETKTTGVSLDRVESTQQLKTYREAFSNLLLTNYEEFRLYRDGQLVASGGPEVCKQLITTGQPGQLSLQQLLNYLPGQAALLRQVIEKMISDDRETWREQHAAIQDITGALKPAEFADMAAQVVVYSLFLARCRDTSADTFSLQEAIDLIPRSSETLRRLFLQLADPRENTEVRWLVDDMVQVYARFNPRQALDTDPRELSRLLLQFYETFLSAYDPGERKRRGAWYTPREVVDAITRLGTDLLDQALGEHNAILRDDVTILDPATGTGTFLEAVVANIHSRLNADTDLWRSFVETNLLPRLYGFEIMPAPYALAHLHMNLLFTSLDHQFNRRDQQVRVLLTNSLEPPRDVSVATTLYHLKKEMNQAAELKRQGAVFVVGNPPYNVASQNKNQWIDSLVDDYKRGMNEKNIKPLSDDYVKFIRFAQAMVETRGAGVVGFITNNGYLDGPVFRKMRQHLLEAFDTIHVINLHGDTRRHVKGDQGVFNIRIGTAVILAAKYKRRPENAGLYYTDVVGKREEKLQFLREVTWESFTRLDPRKPGYEFVPVDHKLVARYNFGLPIDFGSVGINTVNDKVCYTANVKELIKRVKQGGGLPEKHTRDWKTEWAEEDIRTNPGDFRQVTYRPFDCRTTWYSGKVKGFHAYPRKEAFINTNKHTLFLCTTRISRGQPTFQNVFVTKGMVDLHAVSDQTYVINAEQAFQPDGEFAADLLKDTQIQPRDYVEVLDYVYGALWDPVYRREFNDQLRADFPRVPRPENQQDWDRKRRLGEKLRGIHLLEGITPAPTGGSGMAVRKPAYHDDLLWISHERWIQLSKAGWEAYIGYYRPVKKWLSYRQNTDLTYQQLDHLRKICAAMDAHVDALEEFQAKNC